MLEWPALVALYPFVKDLANKIPGLKEAIQKENRKENALIDLQLETIQKAIDLSKTIEFTGYVSAKLSSPNAEKADVLKARAWADEVYTAIHLKE